MHSPQNFRQSAGSVNRPSSRSSSMTSQSPYGMGYPQQQQQHQQQYQNYRASASSINRPSSRASAMSSKSGFFGSRKKNKAKDYDDFDDEDGEAVDMSSAPGQAPGDFMDQLTLIDRDRYPTMNNPEVSQGRTMSLTSSLSTTPIIPTLGESQDHAYRKNLIKNHKMHRPDEFAPGPMGHPGYGGPNYGMRSPNGPGGPAGPGAYGMRSPNSGRPLPPQEMMRLRSPSGSNIHGPPNPDYYHHPPPNAASAQGRSMSMGGYSRGPPPVNMGGPIGPGYGRPPPGRKSLPNGPAVNGGPMQAIPPTTNNQRVPPGPSAPNSTSSQVSLPGAPGMDLPPAHSRSSSKSSSPSPAANSMSRPNSQALSASSSVPEPLANGKSDTVPAHPRADITSSKEILPIQKGVESTERLPQPIALKSTSASVDQDHTIVPKTSSLAHTQTLKTESIERSTSPFPTESSAQSASVPATTARTEISTDTVELIEDLKERNVHLLDEVRLVTSELADSIRRELGLSDDPSSSLTGDLPSPALAGADIEAMSMSHRDRALLVLRLQSQLDVERRKRIIAEDKLFSLDNGVAHTRQIKSLYDASDLDAKLAEAERNLSNKEFENENLRTELKHVNEKHAQLSEEAVALKDGKSQRERDMEILTAAGNPVELLKSIDELKVENKKLHGIIEENSSRGPLGEKVKEIESQRDALREALRSLRERKDHEIRQHAERIRQLDSKLEKERVVNSQLQRKYVQGQVRTPSGNTPTNNGMFFNGPLPSPSVESLTLQLPKRRGPSESSSYGELAEPASPAHSATSGASRQGASSPLPHFSVGNEPSWMDNHREPLPNGKFGHHASNSSLGSVYSSQSTTLNLNSTSSLSLPHGRTEQLPLSLGNGI